MELFRKIAFGAYYITLKQNNDKIVAYIASKIVISTAIMIWLLFFMFISILLGTSFKLPPFAYIYLISVVFSTVFPLNRKDMDFILTTGNQQYINKAVKLFWLSIFGPIGVLLILLIFFKLFKL